MKIFKPEILFEDEYLLVINKPAGMLSVPDRFNPDLPNLISAFKPRYPDLIPVHRLDKFTSGVILLAKDAETHRMLSEQFMSRDVEKYYLAIVDGTPEPESGHIEAPLAESTVTRGKMLVHKRGKASVTDYKILKKMGKYSLVYLRLHTGRMHQVRVHMQYLGNPLIVDELYGHRREFFLSEIKHKNYKHGKFDTEQPLLSRQPLHAEKLIFIHPVTLNRMEITAPMPKDMEAVLRQMEKWLA